MWPEDDDVIIEGGMETRLVRGVAEGMAGWACDDPPSEEVT